MGYYAGGHWGYLENGSPLLLDPNDMLVFSSRQPDKLYLVRREFRRVNNSSVLMRNTLTSYPAVRAPRDNNNRWYGSFNAADAQHSLRVGTPSEEGQKVYLIEMYAVGADRDIRYRTATNSRNENDRTCVMPDYAARGDAPARPIMTSHASHMRYNGARLRVTQSASSPHPKMIFTSTELGMEYARLWGAEEIDEGDIERLNNLTVTHSPQTFRRQSLTLNTNGGEEVTTIGKYKLMRTGDVQRLVTGENLSDFARINKTVIGISVPKGLIAHTMRKGQSVSIDLPQGEYEVVQSGDVGDILDYRLDVLAVLQTTSVSVEVDRYSFLSNVDISGDESEAANANLMSRLGGDPLTNDETTSVDESWLNRLGF